MQSKDYNPHEIEPKVQSKWQQNNAFASSPDGNKDNNFYALSMFPYPSGNLHMGHVRNYTITDVIARYQTMLGKNVLHPMGWDAFGLPAENKAIETGNSPASWTRKNIAYMKKQLQRLGLSCDWQQEVATCDSAYYKLEQEFFIKMYENGLIYRKKSLVNWDPIDNTVLANEQVIDGRGWRSGALVEKKEMTQWFIKITDYADRLLADIDSLDEWPEKVKQMQRHWIGKSTGVEISFQLVDSNKKPLADFANLDIYTTRADTIFGVSYVAVAAEHKCVKQLLKSDIIDTAKQKDIVDFIEQTRKVHVTEANMESLEKQGVITGIYALNPVNQEIVPVLLANFVLIDYGTGAVMAVPAHDQRDFEFAVKYDLPIKQVIQPNLQSNAQSNSQSNCENVDLTKNAFVDKGVLINSAKYNDLPSDEAIEAIAKDLTASGDGKKITNYRLRDWAISRQRYWGAPIPMVDCQKCGMVPVNNSDLPVVLPTDVKLDGCGSPLKNMPSFVDTICPKCNAVAKRETDTFDTFFESSWYFLHFACKDKSLMLDEQAKKWLPVNQYVGGIEHAVLHLLYARFFYKVLLDLSGDVATKSGNNEPFTALLTQGMVLAETYYIKQDNGSYKWFNPSDVNIKKDDKGKIITATLADNREVVFGGLSKMSKSKNNGIDPQEMIEKYGADAVRLFIIFTAPPQQNLEWSIDGVEGSYRYLKRFYKLAFEHIEQLNGQKNVATASQDLSPKLVQAKILLHKTIGKVIDDLGRRHKFNTAVASLMELTNLLVAVSASEQQDLNYMPVMNEAIKAITLLLAPIAPHICQDIWQHLSDAELLNHPLPLVDNKLLKEQQIVMVIQVNGKVRAKINVSSSANEAEIREQALANENIQKFITKPVKKVIVVPKKLISIVC